MKSPSAISSHYQVVVIGGGMVGASFALAFAKELVPNCTAQVLVAEAAGPADGQGERPGFDARSTALSYGSRKILERLGLWAGIDPVAEPIHQIHVSDRGHFGSTKLRCDELGIDALGYVLENQLLSRMLHNSLDKCPSTRFLKQTVASHISPGKSGMELLLQHQGMEYRVSADLVVLADGGRSPLCQQLGIGSRLTSYRQHAIISNIACTRPHSNIAYERFTESGPLALLPLPQLEGENRVALVWTVPEQEGPGLMALPDSEAIEVLQERFGYRLGRIVRIGKRFSYTLGLSVAQEQIRPGLVLLGNAAHSLHPVAGQGFNLSLRDAEALARLAAAAIQGGESPGSMQVLQKFVTAQEKDQHRTIDFSHYLTLLFSTGRPSQVWLRKAGLAAIDLIPSLKREFARQAMGLGS